MSNRYTREKFYDVPQLDTHQKNSTKKSKKITKGKHKTHYEYPPSCFPYKYGSFIIKND